MKSTNKLVPFFAFWIALALALSIFIGQGLGQEGSTVGEAATASVPNPVYLPIVLKPPNTIYGYVTDDGVPAVGVELNLWFYNGTWSSILETTTDGNGYYYFRDMPALLPGQKYGVEYFNEVDPSRLYFWQTVELTSFPDGSSVNIGNFDIANVELTSPIGKLLVGLPSTFQWTPRPATPNDSYEFNLSDYDGVINFSTDPPLNYTGSYNLSSLPPGFIYCLPYLWYVNIHSLDGGTGSSFWAAWVTLYSAAPAGIHGCVSEAGVPRSGVPVTLLRFTPPDTEKEMGAVNTNSSGYFQFTGKGSLNPGQFYFVEYENVSDGPSRVIVYDTRALESYTSGSSVHIGDFDIANITLNLPPPVWTGPLPMTFNWVSRLSTPWDTYDFNLFDPNDEDPWVYTPPLGYVNQFTVNELPPGLSYSVLYGWAVGVWDPFGGTGLSYEYRDVTFTSTGMSAAPEEGSAGLRWDRQRLEAMRRANMGRPEIRPFVHPKIDAFRGHR